MTGRKAVEKANCDVRKLAVLQIAKLMVYCVVSTITV